MMRNRSAGLERRAGQEVKISRAETATTTAPTMEQTQIRAFLLTSSFGFTLMVAGLRFAALIVNQPFRFRVIIDITIVIVFFESRNITGSRAGRMTLFFLLQKR